METDLVARLQSEIDDLMRRMPAHSTPPAMLERLDELEAALAEAKARASLEERSGVDSNDRR